MNTTTQAQFSGTLKQWAEKLKVKAGTLQKKITFDLQAELIKRTPVRTGRAASNWHASVGAPSEKVTDGPTTPDSALSLQMDGSQPSYVVNNVHYIPYLNNGTERMAPVGMREGAMQKVGAELEKSLAAAK